MQNIAFVFLPEASCPYFEVEHSEREVDTYLVGGHMVITECAEGYTLLGETEYDCKAAGDGQAEWNPSPNAECKGKREWIIVQC